MLALRRFLPLLAFAWIFFGIQLHARAKVPNFNSGNSFEFHSIKAGALQGDHQFAKVLPFDLWIAPISSYEIAYREVAAYFSSNRAQISISIFPSIPTGLSPPGRIVLL